MTQHTHVEPEQLVSYLYDECDPGERAHIAAHLGICPPCADEAAALIGTRQQLAGWASPEVALGFQIPRASASAVEPPGPAMVLRPRRWWSQPLPAWAQAAAALVVFGAGLAVGTGRQTVEPAAPAAAVSAPPTIAQSLAAPQVAAPAADDRLAREVDALRAELASLRRASTAAPAPAANVQLIDQIRALIDESEQRQRIEFTARSAQMARDFEVQRRVDMAQVNQTLGRVEGQAGAEYRSQRQAIEGLARAVSLGAAPR